MSWAKLDDRLHSHTKARKAGLEAMGLWVLCLSHCAAQLTDGFVDLVDIETIGGKNGLNLAERLVSAGLWQHVEGGFEFRDYLDHNPSAEEVRAQREKYKQRQAKRRPAPGTVSRGSTRDTHVDTHVVSQGASRVTLSERHGECPPECHASPDPDPDPNSHTHSAGARAAVPDGNLSANTAAILAALRTHAILAPVATPVLADQIEGRRMNKGSLVAWIVTAIDDAARDAGAESASGSPPSAMALAKTIVRYCDRARAPIAATPRGQGATKATPVQPRSPNADKWGAEAVLSPEEIADPFYLLKQGKDPK